MDGKITDKITIQESSLLIPSNKSKRLAALREQSLSKQKTATLTAETKKTAFVSRTNKDVTDALNEARACIRKQIERIKRRYPPGKQNKLFAIRYGDFDKLKRKSIKEIFALLNLDANLRNFESIEHLDYEGHATGAAKTGTIDKARKYPSRGHGACSDPEK